MVEARKCVRCGCMYISETEVCGKCETKDGVDLYKLKGFFSENDLNEVTHGQISAMTGIADKNLSRFLKYDEFKDININEKNIAASLNLNNGIELV